MKFLLLLFLTIADECTVANEEVLEEVWVKGVEEDMDDVEEVQKKFVEKPVQRGKEDRRS